jgi:alginate O-acetyltransferase complex protein AlgI
MLFNSYIFIFIFLPVTFGIFFFINKFYKGKSIYFLAFASLCFYIYSSLIWIPLLIVLIIINFFISLNIKGNKSLLIFSVFLNLGIILYFKYSIFLKNIIEEKFLYLNFIIPLGISFYTFNQIAYLMDCYNGKIARPRFINFLFIIIYFPHLIAGPFLRYKSVIAQIKNGNYFSISKEKIYFGLIIFTLGLSKKIFIADEIGYYADNFFNSVANGNQPQFLISWLGSLSFLFQLYFDFSGYSDMAIGISLLFGIILPVNFNSPLKSISIIEFWQKWHITLTNLIFEFLYIPITTTLVRFVNFFKIKNLNINFFTTLVIPIFLSFLIIGIWHGGTSNYLYFGLINGFFMILNHIWREKLKKKIIVNEDYNNKFKFLYWLITFLCVLISMVFFRSESAEIGLKVIKGMLGFNGAGIPEQLKNIIPFLKNYQTGIVGISNRYSFDYLVSLLCLCFFASLYCKNLNNLSISFIDKNLQINKNIYYKKFSFIIGFILFLCVINLNKNSSFLYFNF